MMNDPVEMGLFSSSPSPVPEHPEMEYLKKQCLSCQACPLCKTRNSVVFGVGPVPSNVVFVGEGPGQQEDLQGEPFVGAAGKLLDDMLGIIDLSRKNTYICNIVKCRPPNNRDPLPEEQDACFGYLERQLTIHRPRIIVCLGRIAAMRLIRPDFRITKEHGTWTERNGVWYTAMYHPSALLRDPSKRPDTFTDLLSLRDKIQSLSLL